VRFLVELEHDASGRVVGTVQSGQDRDEPFDGWLALVRLLERRAGHQREQGGTDG
jgi:hypothetical protein